MAIKQARFFQTLAIWIEARYGCGQVEEKMTGGPKLQLDQSKTDEYDHGDAQPYSGGQKIQASSLGKLQQGGTDAKKGIEKNG